MMTYGKETKKNPHRIKHPNNNQPTKKPNEKPHPCLGGDYIVLRNLVAEAIQSGGSRMDAAQKLLQVSAPADLDKVGSTDNKK